MEIVQQKRLFESLEVGDLFIFIYEVRFQKFLEMFAEQTGKSFNIKYLPLISVMEKISESGYQTIKRSADSLIIDNRRIPKAFPQQKGFCCAGAEVYVVT